MEQLKGQVSAKVDACLFLYPYIWRHTYLFSDKRWGASFIKTKLL